MIAVIQEEAQWRRVANFVVFLHTGQPNLVDNCRCAVKLELCFLGGLSSADWSSRRLGGCGSMPTTDGTAAAHSGIPSPGVTLMSRQKRKVFENRDLCRIVGLYLVAIYGGK